MKSSSKTYLSLKHRRISFIMCLLWILLPNCMVSQQAAVEEKKRIESIVDKYLENSNFKYCQQKTKDSLVLKIRDSITAAWTPSILTTKTDRDLNDFISSYVANFTLSCVPTNKKEGPVSWNDTLKNSVKELAKIFLQTNMSEVELEAFTSRVKTYTEFNKWINEWAERNGSKEELYKYLFNKTPDDVALPSNIARSSPKKGNEIIGTWRRKNKILSVDYSGYSVIKIKCKDTTFKYVNETLALKTGFSLSRFFKWHVVEISPDRMKFRRMGIPRTFKKSSSEVNGIQLGSAHQSANRENWVYFKNYQNWQKEIISNHWVQYFKDDIHQKLDSTIPMFPIKMDSYGNAYPSPAVLAKICNKGFEDPDLDDRNMFRFSLFNVFLNNNKQIRENIANFSEADKKFYTDLIAIATKNKMYLDNKDLFNEKWQEHQADNLATNIKTRLNQLKRKQVLFFVHGYNVPYSLANVQAIELIKLLGKQGIDTSQFLTVPIFWSSNDAKKLNLQSEETFSTMNEIRPDNGFKFMHYSNRAYFASIAFRKLLGALSDNDIKIFIFSHSLGASLVTSAVINTFSKLDYTSDLEYKTGENWTAEDCVRFRDKEPVNFYLVKGWRETALPKRKLRFFLSAAAIPGVTTFTDLGTDLEPYYLFYSTINPRDEMLTKSAVPLPGIKATNMSATSLGCNYNGEAKLTQTLFRDKKKFVLPVDETHNQDHDILTYMRQPEYIEFVVKFFKEN